MHDIDEGFQILTYLGIIAVTFVLPHKYIPVISWLHCSITQGDDNYNKTNPFSQGYEPAQRLLLYKFAISIVFMIPS